MKIAYLILAHNTPNHLGRLIDALNTDGVHFFVHIDNKADIVLFKQYIKADNVYFLPKRRTVGWGDFSAVEATLDLLRLALVHRIEFSYFCLLSGSDYPVQSNQYIHNFFEKKSGGEFISLVEIPNAELNKSLDRLNTYKFPNNVKNLFLLKLIMRLNEFLRSSKLIQRDHQKVFGGLKPFAGSQWWALTRPAVVYTLDFIESHPGVVNYFRNTFIPDEMFFQTIIGNSPFSKNVKYSLTYVNWPKVHAISPKEISLEQIKDLFLNVNIGVQEGQKNARYLFARKFPDKSESITRQIDQLTDRQDKFVIRK